MEQPKKISSNIKFRKYFLSWFVLLMTYLITEFLDLNRFWNYAAWTISILIFILFISLKKVAYTKSAVYFGSKKVDYESIIDLKIFEIQQNPFYLFKTNSKSILNRYFLTQLGGFSYFSIINILISRKSQSEIPLVEFLELLDKKSNIPKSK